MNKHNIHSEFSYREIEQICQIADADRIIFKKNDTMISAAGNENLIGIIEKGCAYLVSINISGETAIIDIYGEGDIFGKSIFPYYNLNLYYVYAKKQTVASVFSANTVRDAFLSGSELMIRFYEYMLKTSNSKMMLHNDILSQKSIREKLIAYFRCVSFNCDRKEFTLPISLSDLSDYIAVDRSAMMREIRKLNNEGIILSKGTKINLLQQ